MGEHTAENDAPYCGLCDGDHHPRDCAATRAILASEQTADEIPPDVDHVSGRSHRARG